MAYKRLIPCIFIAEGKAVKWFNDKSTLSDDVVGLAKYYSDYGADELLIFDLSDTDEEHDECIHSPPRPRQPMPSFSLFLEDKQANTKEKQG